jgi:hypothetical protein
VIRRAIGSSLVHVIAYALASLAIDCHDPDASIIFGVSYPAQHRESESETTFMRGMAT